ncbi:MAG: polysaccharide pyruvyl transferase family protein [Deltaproteobacteria bacterium]|nr:polysaccharide pyruvyl transferase family protein [Deltaproteobacteria bacterium]
MRDTAPRQPPPEIALITRVRTLNKGNQALSAAWVGLLREAFPGSAIRLIERRPRHLLQYTLPQLAGARDPYREFDALTSRLARLAPGPGHAGAPDPTATIVLDETIPTPIRFADIRARLNLRGWMARTGRYRREYIARLAMFQRAQFVVLNPAGEFFPRSPEPAFYYLVEAHVAHKLGRPTAIVNHTMDIDDPTLRALIPRVYRELELVGFRDSKSIETYKTMGGDLANVVVSPDLALASRVGPVGALRRNTVAIAINVPEGTARGYCDQWLDVIRGLQAHGLEVVLVSNEFPSDLTYYEQLRRTLGVKIEGGALDYDRYAALLGSFDVVVSSRMHTAILGMVGGAPVVAVEGASFKITGLFQELGLAGPVIRPSSPGWAQAVITQVLHARTHRSEVVSEIASKLHGIRTRIGELLVPRLRAAEAAAA